MKLGRTWDGTPEGASAPANEGGPQRPRRRPRCFAGLPSQLLYWLGMTHRVGAKGQVVIPKDLRERAGLMPGADVEFAWDGSGVRIRAADTSDEMGGRFAHSGMAARLLDDRSREPR